MSPSLRGSSGHNGSEANERRFRIAKNADHFLLSSSAILALQVTFGRVRSQLSTCRLEVQRPEFLQRGPDLWSETAGRGSVYVDFVTVQRDQQPIRFRALQHLLWTG